jgi:outer membrane receptor for ferrienterochelin and colicin
LRLARPAAKAGVWEIPSVLCGSYTVTVKAQGFNKTTVEKIAVDAGATATADATLQIGLEDQVVVTASKFEEEVVNAPATATVISEQTIRDLPTQNIADLLRAVPGMNVSQTSAGQTGVTGRSACPALPGTQLVLVDGRTIYLDFMGVAFWELVPTSLDEVKQMEVIRGPASAVWGAYAMNGVVNILTKPPREMLGTTFTLGIGTFDRSGGAAESNRGSLYYISATRCVHTGSLRPAAGDVPEPISHALPLVSKRGHNATEGGRARRL